MKTIACWAAVLGLGLGVCAETGAGEHQDVVVFTDARPVVFRLRVEVEGRPLLARWEEYLAGYFEFLDRDGDGALDKDEVARLPDARALRYQIQGLVGYFGNSATRPALADLDVNLDGKVGPGELRAYLRDHGAAPLQVAAYPSNPPFSSDDLSAALFARLDADRDGALSEGEAGRAGEALALFDVSDDEMLTGAEILGTPLGVTWGRLSGPLPDGGGQVFVLDPSARTPLKQGLPLADAALARYDRDRDGKLSPAEMELPAPGLDGDGDGRLDRLELVGLARLEVDVEAVVRLASRGRQPPEAVEVLRPREGVTRETADPPRPVARGRGPTRGLPDVPVSLAVPLEGMRFRLTRGAGQLNAPANYAAYFKEIIKRLDTEGLGYLTRKQVEPAQYLALRALFDLADRDGDDRLTEKEAVAFLEMNGKAAGTVATLSFEKNGRGLFEMLDGDGDGRLSARELRSAWSRLKGNDRDRDGKVTLREVPVHYQLAVSRGASPYGRSTAMTAPRPAPPPPARGPAWFRKMDRNRDGDVSRREFLGPPEVFAQMDADGDGLIDAGEAEKADALMRAGK